MNTKIILPLFSLVIIVFITSCDRPECINNNPIFDQFKPASQEYKNELVKEMQRIGEGKLRYWVHMLIREGGKDYLELYIQGDNLCAMILVKNYTNRLKIKSRKLDFIGGGGYRGARLTGVKIVTKNDSAGIDFILESVDRVID